MNRITDERLKELRDLCHRDRHEDEDILDLTSALDELVERRTTPARPDVAARLQEMMDLYEDKLPVGAVYRIDSAIDDLSAPGAETAAPSANTIYTQGYDAEGDIVLRVSRCSHDVRGDGYVMNAALELVQAIVLRCVDITPAVLYKLLVKREYAAPGAESAAPVVPHEQPVGEQQAGLSVAGDAQAILRRAIYVFEDVLTDIEDWEDTALADAVSSARDGLRTLMPDQPVSPAVPAVPAGWKLLKDSTWQERAWAEDSGHENGNYSNTCCTCGREFVGHKRRVSCKVCAAAPTAPAVEAPPKMTASRIDSLSGLGRRNLYGGIIADQVYAFADDIQAARDEQWRAAIGGNV